MRECAIMAVLFRRLQSGGQLGNGHGSPFSMQDGEGERRKPHPPACAPKANIGNGSSSDSIIIYYALLLLAAKTAAMRRSGAGRRPSCLGPSTAPTGSGLPVDGCDHRRYSCVRSRAASVEGDEATAA